MVGSPLGLLLFLFLLAVKKKEPKKKPQKGLYQIGRIDSRKE